MLAPRKHLNLDVSVLRISSIMLRELSKRGVLEFERLRQIVERRVGADDLPIKNIRASSEGDQHYFVGDLTHPKERLWSEYVDTYKSGYCGTSIIVPVWGKIADPFLIHFMTLYALSIVVRYLPLLWHEIEDGNLNHIRALIEQYLAIVDNVLPQMAIERITGRRLIAVQPGSLFGPM